MSVLLEPSSSLALPRRTPVQARIPRFTLPMLTLLALMLGFAGGQWTATADAQADMEQALVLLLRFMALIKLATVVALAAFAQWQLAKPASRPVVFGFRAACMLMALAPGFIWHLSFMAAGAGLFHAGLIVFVVLCWRDHAMQDGLQDSPRRRAFRR